MPKDGIIIETLALGNSLKVTAIDTVTGVEASVVADKRTTELARQQLAIRKLEYVLKKHRNPPVN